MKLFRLFFLALFCATTLLSCKKDDEDQNPNPQPDPVIPTYDNYSALKVGNYWIYQHFRTDTLGNATPLPEIDSCYIQSDTLLNGHTYYKLVKPNPYHGGTIYPDFYLLRDSLHYIVSHSGKIYFSSEDNNTIFARNYYYGQNSDTVASVVTKMDAGVTSTAVPAGVFTTRNVKRTYKLHPAYAPDRRYGYEYIRYAKNVGILTETLVSYMNEMNQGISRERRLIRYHVQP